MKFDDAFLEYLVLGAMSLIWLLPAIFILGIDINGLKDLKEIILVLILPILYVTGMIIHFIGDILFKEFRLKIKKNIFQEQSTAKYNLYYVLMHTSKNFPEILKQFEKRDSRSRIARGTFINFFTALLIMPFFCYWFKDTKMVIASIVLLGLFSFISFSMYKHFLTFFYKFQLELIKSIKLYELTSPIIENKQG